MLRDGVLMRVLGLGALLLAWAATATTASSITFYVSPRGKDGWSGTLSTPNAAGTDGPFATFPRAVRAVRDALRAGRADVTVFFRAGTYVLTKTLVFTPDDSGSEGHPVVYAAYPSEKVVISSGRAITGWRKYDGNLWVAEVPKGWYFTRMFVNGRMATRSREPDTDNWHRWFRVVEGGPPEPDAPEGAGSKRFKYPEGTVRNWPNLGDIEINSLPTCRYANFICPLAAVDEVASTLTLASMAYYNYQPGDPFRVENTLEGVDEPGEWCVNSVEGKVYYLPRPGEDMSRATVIAPALTELIRFQGDEARQRWVHDITLRGFTFTHCDRRRWNGRDPEDEENLHLLDAAVVLVGAQRCGIEHCRFVDVAGFAARFRLTALNNRFVNNEVVGAGCGGLQAGGYGPGTKDTNRGHEISFNHIHHCSTDWWHAGAIDLRQSGENHIAYNLVHHMPYTGICISGAHTSYFRQYRGHPGVGRANYRFRWDEIPADNPLTAESVKPFLHGRNNVVEHNVVYEIGARLPADGGALYGFAQGLGNVFRNNLVFRSYCLGIYLDNEFDGVLVEGNVVYDCGQPFGGAGGYPTLKANELYQRGTEPPAVRMLSEQLVWMAEQATGPHWHRAACLLGPLEPPKPKPDPNRRRFEVSFNGLEIGPLEGQGGWQPAGAGGGIEVVPANSSGQYEPAAAVQGFGADCWAGIWHGMILDPSRDLVLQIDARLPDPLESSNFFELYLNRGLIHANEAFGIALLGGKQDGEPNMVGVRRDAAGPRMLAAEKLLPGHWYRLRMVVPGGSDKARLLLRDLTAGQTEFVRLTFADGAAEADVTSGDDWQPSLADLDALILRLGGNAQVAGIVLENG
jgi:hypothetical protein